MSRRSAHRERRQTSISHESGHRTTQPKPWVVTKIPDNLQRLYNLFVPVPARPRTPPDIQLVEFSRGVDETHLHLRQELEQRDRTIAALQQAVRVAQHQHQDQQDSIASLTRTIEETKQSLDKKNVVAAALKQAIEEAQHQLEEKEATIARLTQAVKESQQQLEQMEATNAVLDHIVGEVQQQLEQKDVTIAELMQTLKETREQVTTESANVKIAMSPCNTTASALKASEAACRSLRAQLEISPEFRRTEQADGISLLQLFEDLQDDVSDFVHSLRRRLDRSATLSPEGADALLCSDHPCLRRMSVFFQQSVTHDSNPQSTLTCAMTYVTVSALTDAIFTSICVNGKDLDGVLTTMLHKLHQQEPQVACGRWRAMTFHSLRTPETDPQTAGGLAIRILEEISQLLSITILASQEDRQRLVDASASRAVSLVSMALKLHDAIQGEYVSTDYRVFLPEIFKPAVADQVKVDDTAGRTLARGGAWPAVTVDAPGAHVLLPTSLGLQATRVDILGTEMSEYVRPSKVLLYVPPM